MLTNSAGTQEADHLSLVSFDSALNRFNYEKEHVSELSGDIKFAYIWYVIFAGLCFITSAALFYIMIKVVKKVGSQDKILPLMLIML